MADEINDLTKAIDTLTNVLLDAQRKAQEEKDERKKRLDMREQGYSDSDIERLLAGEYSEVQGAGGLFQRMMSSGAPSGRAALSTMGYAQGIRSRRISQAMGFGEMLRMGSSPYAMPGADIYDESGKNIPYSSGDVKNIMRAGINEKEQVYAHAYSAEYLANNKALISQLSPDQQKQVQSYLNSSLAFSRGEIGKREMDDARRALQGSVGIGEILGRGANLSSFADAGIAGLESVQGMANVGRARSIMGVAGAGLQSITRFAGGPASVAYEAAKTVYKTADMLYEPGRQGRALGYGGSFEGYRVGLERSMTTQLDALGSFALSREQTLGARRALEGMGAGGPGSERLYDSYYKSMTDVISETQLDPNILAPFYEQFMRQGGTEDEVASLTKMLKDDLPKAAAASRMSLQGMAEMIQKTTEAASASPFNYRTKTEISQALVSAQAAGAPPGFANIAAGNNALAVAQTAGRLGVGYYEAVSESGQLQVTAAQGVQQMLGDMTGDEFREYRQTPEGQVMVKPVADMYGLTVDDIQKLYDQGIDNFEASAVLNDAFSDENLGKVSTETKRVGSAAGARGLGSMRDVKEAVSQKIIGKDIDLYKDKGSKLKSEYGTEIAALEESLKDLGKTEELSKFQEQLKDLEGDKAIKTWELLQQTAKDVGQSSATGEQDGGVEGMISLSDEAKKFFKLDWSSSTQNPNPPNTNWSSGSTEVG